MRKILNSIFFLLIIAGGIFINMENANAESQWKFHLTPNITEGVNPVLTAETTGQPESLTVITQYDGKEEKSVYESAAKQTFKFPKVEKDTYVYLNIHNNPAEPPIGKFNTLLRPDGQPLIKYEGEKMVSEDFDKYWEKALKELSDVPFKSEVKRVPEKDTVTGLLHRVELPAVENTTIVCWYYVPKSAFDEAGKVVKKFPAMQVMPGYGAEEPPIDRTAEGFITLSVNPRNHGPSKDFWKSPVEHLLYNIDNPDKYYYKLAYLDCVRAAEFLFSREEVDIKNVAAEGGSQGGLFAIAVSALYPKFACVCSNVTAFSDYHDGVALAQVGHHSQFAEKIGGRENFTNDFIKKIPETDKEKLNMIKSLLYTDGSNLAPKVKCPVQINMGGQDNVCPYVTGIVVYNRIASGIEKEYNITPDIKHEVPNEIRENNKKWYKKYLNNK